MSKVPGGPSESVVPGEGPATYVDWSGVDRDADYWTREEQKVTRDAPVELKRIQWIGDTAWFTVNSFSSAKHWDGRPLHQTGGGWGR